MKEYYSIELHKINKQIFNSGFNSIEGSSFYFPTRFVYEDPYNLNWLALDDYEYPYNEKNNNKIERHLFKNTIIEKTGDSYREVATGKEIFVLNSISEKCGLKFIEKLNEEGYIYFISKTNGELDVAPVSSRVVRDYLRNFKESELKKSFDKDKDIVMPIDGHKRKDIDREIYSLAKNRKLRKLDQFYRISVYRSDLPIMNNYSNIDDILENVDNVTKFDNLIVGGYKEDNVITEISSGINLFIYDYNNPYCKDKMLKTLEKKGYIYFVNYYDLSNINLSSYDYAYGYLEYDIASDFIKSYKIDLEQKFDIKKDKKTIKRMIKRYRKK